MKSAKRLVGILLSCVLFAGFMPGDVYAEGGDGERKTVSASSFQDLDLQIADNVCEDRTCYDPNDSR